MGRTINRFTEL